jgi:hypothetical protein
MLLSIDKEKFAEAIKQSYKMMNDVSSLTLATQLIESLDVFLEEAVEAWIEGREIPDVAFDKYSVKKILSIRNNDDYLEAFRLLSEYKKDSAIGEKQIWKPIRGRR